MKSCDSENRGSWSCSKVKFKVGNLLVLMMARIDTLTFKFGPTKGVPGQTVQVPSVLLFVGPNESGKTLASILIKEWYDGSHDTIDARMFADASFKVFDRDEALAFLKPLESAFHAENEQPIWTGDIHGSISHDRSVNLLDFCSADAFKEKNWRSSHLSRFRIAPRLENVLSVMQETDARPLGATGRFQNLHQLLLVDRTRLNKVNRIIHAACGFYVAVQLLDNGKFRLQLNPEPPPDEVPGMILSTNLQSYYKNGTYVEAFGDGLRAFLGLVMCIFPFEHKLVVLDEPELHLHPPLANRLAQELVHEIVRRNGQLIIATHSSDIVAGCIAATDDIAMARLTFSKVSGQATAKVVAKTELEPFVSNSVVRNTDALAGIFHEATIAVEGVFDKIAYAEFNRCLQLQGRDIGIRDPHFVSAGSCAQVLKVAHVMRQTGTPAAAILDFDVLYSDSIDWQKGEMDRLGVDGVEQDEMLKSLVFVKQELRKCVAGLTKDQAKQKVKHEGINLLNDVERTKTEALLRRLSQFGLFIAAQGELESMVAHGLQFNRTGIGKETTIDFGMKKLASHSYVIPDDLTDPTRDIWSLLDNVGRWARKQIE